LKHRALVIGLGQIGMGYDLKLDPDFHCSTLARAFSMHPDFELTGGVDSEFSRRKLFEAEYSRPSFSCIDIAIAETKPNIIVISVPTKSHFKVFLDVLKLSTPQVILCEKPLSYELNEAEEMIRIASDSGVILLTNYMRRCDPGVIQVRNRIVSKKITGPIKGVCWYSKGIFNNGSHFLNLLQYWMGEVQSFKVIKKGRVIADNDPEPDVMVQFELGEVIFMAAQEENFSHYTVELIAQNGRLRYENGIIKWQKTIPDYSHDGYIILSSKAETLKSDQLRLQWHVADQISSLLSNEDTSICSGEQGLSTLQILSQIREQV
jgi:predicted dehydrogenase